MSSASRGMTEYQLMEVVKVTWPVFLILPNHIFGIGEARRFKFRVLIDMQEY